MEAFEQLVATITSELDKHNELRAEGQSLVSQIEDIAAQINVIAEQKSDSELMNKETTILQKITHILDTGTEDTQALHEAITQAFEDTASKTQSGDDESIEKLEEILAKARFSTALATTLRNTLADILKEATALKEKYRVNSL
jgi:hypothetical protein